MSAFWLTSVSPCSIQMVLVRFIWGDPSVELRPAIALSLSLGLHTMLAFEPRDPHRAGLSNVFEENAGIPQNRSEPEGRRHYPRTDCKLCCLVCVAIRSGACNVIPWQPWFA